MSSSLASLTTYFPSTIVLQSHVTQPLCSSRGRMDVTLLLNSVRPPSSSGGRNERSPGQPTNHETLSPPKTLPLPWVADANRGSYRYNGQNARLWDVVSFTGTRIDDTDSRTTASLPVSPKEIERAGFERNIQINQPPARLVLGTTSQIPIHLAKHTISR